MRRFFLNLPIRYKIVGLTVLVVLLVVLPTFYFVLKQEFDLVDKNLTRQCQTLINLLDSDVDLLLKNPSQSQAKDFLSPLEKFSEVENVAVYLKDSIKSELTMLAQYDKTLAPNSEFKFDLDFIKSQPDRIFDHDGYFYGYSPIERNGEKKGAICLRLTKTHAVSQIKSLALNSIALVVGLLVIAWIIANLIQRRITQPIVYLSEITNKITREGDYSIQVSYNSRDEIGRLYNNFNRLLIRTNNQNQKIQELNFSLDQKIQERVSELTKATEEADSRTKEAEAARLTAESLASELERKMSYDAGLAKFAEIMQARSTQNIEKWGDHLLFHIIEHINGLQGALYSTEDTGASEPKLRLLSTYAYDIKLILKKVIKAGDGFTGEVAKTRRMIYLNDLPEGYLKAVSALGEANPKYLLIMPLIAEDAVQGVLELASFNPFREDDINFLTSISENIAYALLVVKNRDNIEKLLNETRQKNVILEEQESALKNKIEELVETQSRIVQTQTELKTSEERLRALNENLESLVADRTAELQNTLENLQSTQAQLIQSEKMASLGQLIAGVAHEINTPIGAIKASAGNIEDVLSIATQAVPARIVDMTIDQRLVFNIFLNISSNPEKTLTSKEERVRRKEITQILQDKGIEDADGLARKLIDCGIIEIKDEYYEILSLPDALSVVDMVSKVSQLKINLDNIQIASEKTKKIVFALKSYAYKQSDDHMTPTDIRQSLDVILTLYSNQMKQGVELVKNFEDNLPEILTFPDEIGQVWTNIIHNALQAMKFQGKLQIDVFSKDQNIVVDITDTGPGIPDEIQAKVFQPFFTTKPKGEGTGLGLDICNKIVKKHNGEMSLVSQPGKTTFTILLPMEQPA